MYGRQAYIVEATLIVLVFAIVGCVAWWLYAQAVKQPVQDSTKPGTVSSDYKRIVAVGDIVCDPLDAHRVTPDELYCQDAAVAQQITAAQPDALLLLGDLQYEDGSLDKFRHTFAKHWGGFIPIIYPTPGNHEYRTPGAEGYYTYFKDSPANIAPGYYTFALGGWQIFALNSNCDKIGGCHDDSAQLAWLQTQLRASRAACSIAFWHHPRFTSGEYASDLTSKGHSDTFWPQMVAHKTDIVLNGHDHIYERFAPQTADGQPLANGPRQFTVGTGGKSQYKSGAPAANSQKIIDDHFGVLIIDLYPTSYRWEFRNIASQVLDTGSHTCH